MVVLLRNAQNSAPSCHRNEHRPRCSRKRTDQIRVAASEREITVIFQHEENKPYLPILINNPGATKENSCRHLRLILWDALLRDLQLVLARIPSL